MCEFGSPRCSDSGRRWPSHFGAFECLAPQRSAAEIKTVIHAIPADRGVVDVLLQRAKDLPSASLPERPQTKDTLAAAGDLIKVFGTAQPAPA